MPEPCEGIRLDDLDEAQRAELFEIIRRYRERWVIVGPCLDGGWHASPRGDDTAPRVQASSLPEC